MTFNLLLLALSVGAGPGGEVRPAFEAGFLAPVSKLVFVGPDTTVADLEILGGIGDFDLVLGAGSNSVSRRLADLVNEHIPGRTAVRIRPPLRPEDVAGLKQVERLGVWLELDGPVSEALVSAIYKLGPVRNRVQLGPGRVAGNAALLKRLKNVEVIYVAEAGAEAAEDFEALAALGGTPKTVVLPAEAAEKLVAAARGLPGPVLLVVQTKDNQVPEHLEKQLSDAGHPAVGAVIDPRIQADHVRRLARLPLSVVWVRADLGRRVGPAAAKVIATIGPPLRR